MSPRTRAAVLDGSLAYLRALERGASIQEAEWVRFAAAQRAYEGFGTNTDSYKSKHTNLVRNFNPEAGDRIIP